MFALCRLTWITASNDEVIHRLQQALELTQRRIHNRITNDLRVALARWTLRTGTKWLQAFVAECLPLT